MFFGTLNGFTFGTEEVPPLAAMSTKCRFTPGAGNNIKDVGAAAAAASELHFELAYVPANMQLDYVAASQCEDEVFLINVQYSGQSIGFVQVLRRKGPPEFRAETDRAGLVPTTIGARPSVIAGDFLIYMRDDISAWRLVGVGPGPHELQKIAEGLSTD